MTQPKKKPLAATVAPAARTPYTAARRGNDGAVNKTEAFGEALDRRMTEGFNLIHGRLDVIQEDVRENRRDIKGLRKELWDGLREAAADRVRLATKVDLEELRETAAADRRRMEQEAAADRRRLQDEAAADRRRLENKFDAAFTALRAEMNERFAAQERSLRELVGAVSKVAERTEAAAWTRRRFRVAVAAGASLLVIGVVLWPALERVVAALFGS